MPECYKCGSGEHLSVKKTDRQGKKVYMCRDCRYKQMRYVPGKKRLPAPEFPYDPPQLTPEWFTSWRKRSRESQKMILEKRR